MPHDMSKVGRFVNTAGLYSVILTLIRGVGVIRGRFHNQFLIYTNVKEAAP